MSNQHAFEQNEYTLVCYHVNYSAGNCMCTLLIAMKAIACVHVLCV